MACEAGTYKNVNGSSSCVECEAGKYLNATAGSVCAACPAGNLAVSARGSTNVADCLCIAGYSGDSCTACGLGTYKDVNGSAACTACSAGTFLNRTAATQCLACPANSHSVEGSTFCICNGGYSGTDGGECTACEAGSYKAENGSTPCSMCQAGTYLNITGGTACMECPGGNMISRSGTVSVMECICDAGFSGPEGGPCDPCGVGTYTNVNGSSKCFECAAGTYLNMSGGTSCVSCPGNHSHSRPGSVKVDSCVCNAGFTGPSGAQCTACEKGAYKSVNGSSACITCGGGTFTDFVGSTSCVGCPENSDSGVGSSSLSCLCNPGYSGPDGGVCEPCSPGTFKDSSGSASCSRCSASTFSGVPAATACQACAEGTVAAEPTRAECIEPNTNALCLSSSIPVSTECGAPGVLETRGCANALVEYETTGLEVQDWGGSIADVAISCEAFYEWICGALGAEASDIRHCDFYCEFFQKGIREELMGVCSSDEDCFAQRSTTYRLQPVDNTICLAEARYALFSSCSVQDSDKASFGERVNSLLPQVSGNCSAAETDRAITGVSEQSAELFVPAQCLDETDCNFACFQTGFVLTRELESVTARSQYVGTCDCSEVGVFSGELDYTDEISVKAFNALGDSIVIVPFPFLNQMVATVAKDGVECLYGWDMTSGSLIGLPSDSQSLRPSSEVGLAYMGAIEAESNASTVTIQTDIPAQRRSLLQDSGSSLVEVEVCPADRADCRLACIADGFYCQTFTSKIVSAVLYDGVCNCSKVIPTAIPDGTPALFGEFRSDATSSYYFFEKAILWTPSGVATNQSEQNASHSTAAQDMMLRASGSVLSMDIGPGLCTYNWEVRGGNLLGIVGTGSIFPIGTSTPILAYIGLVPLSLSTESAECRDLAEQDCEFQCVFGGSALVNVQKDGIVGSTTDPMCSCSTYYGTVEDNSFAVDHWNISADFAVNALTYTYTGSNNVVCSGWLNVTNGTFLGVPGIFNDTNLTSIEEGLTVQEAKDTAQAISAIVGTATGIVVASVAAAAVTGAVASSSAAIAGASAGVASQAGASVAGGAAVTLVTQCGRLSQLGRVGGGAQPDSTLALSEGLGWANFHPPFSLYSDEDGGAARRRARRARGGGGTVGDELDAEEGDEIFVYEVRGCAEARASPRELWGTVVACVSAVVITHFVRRGLNHLISWFKRRNGLEDTGRALHFPVWESEVILMFFQGLAESAGEAIASGCLEYEVGGALVLTLLLFFMFGMTALVVIAVKYGVISWKHHPVKETWPLAKERLSGLGGKPLIYRIRRLHECCVLLNGRGKWVFDRQHHGTKVVGKKFADRFGPLFDEFQGGAWWYGFWAMSKALVTAFILASVLSPETNAIFILTLNTVDSVFILTFLPDGFWLDFLNNTMVSMVNLCTLSTIVAYVQGILPDAIYTDVFQFLAVVSLVPSILISILEPCIEIVSKMSAFCTFVISFCSVGAGFKAGAAGVAGVAAGDQEAQQDMLRAMDKDAEDDREKSFQRRRSMLSLQSDLGNGEGRRKSLLSLPRSDVGNGMVAAGVVGVGASAAMVGGAAAMQRRKMQVDPLHQQAGSSMEQNGHASHCQYPPNQNAYPSQHQYSPTQSPGAFESGSPRGWSGISYSRDFFGTRVRYHQSAQGYQPMQYRQPSPERGVNPNAYTNSQAVVARPSPLGGHAPVYIPVQAQPVQSSSRPTAQLVFSNL